MRGLPYTANEHDVLKVCLHVISVTIGTVDVVDFILICDSKFIDFVIPV